MLKEKYKNSDINIFNSTQNVNLETILSYRKSGKCRTENSGCMRKKWAWPLRSYSDRSQ